MRFSLQDVKRQVRRRDDEMVVIFHFLRPDELQTEIARLIACYEQQCGQPRKSFLQEEASTCIDDYRLAGCLISTLSFWYAWQQPAWTACIQDLSAEARVALSAAAIDSPLHLRLALFDYVNLHHTGFLDAQTRFTALTAFAALFHLDVLRLEALLALDTEDEAILTRTTSAPPNPHAVAQLYNQWVFEAALCNASEVQFLIDCEAFLVAQRDEATGVVSGIGAVIKRLCFLARRLGVYYDLAYEAASSSTRPTLLSLTLYGPQEMTGSPQQYGQRLARLCRLLLRSGTAPSSLTRSQRQSASALKAAIRQARATVHLFQNAYHFQMGADLLALLPEPAPTNDIPHAEGPTALYDSGIEQSFAEAFAALERSHGTAGWQLEREPEPLLFAGPIAGILLPDFALTRDKRRIYVEILGFWTPAYRERKMQKLQALKGRTDLVLALPVEAHQAFASLAGDFPLLEYDGQLSATELLHIVQAHYDDFAGRLAGLDVVGIQARIRAECFVPERASYELLHCYRRAELLRAIPSVLTADIAHTAGLGLYLRDWLEHLHSSFVEWIEAKSVYELSLSLIIQEWQTGWPILAACDEAAIEALINLWPEVQIQHSSLFEARVLVMACPPEKRCEETVAAQVQKEIEGGKMTVSSRKVGHSQRGATRKQISRETSQQNLWE